MIVLYLFGVLRYGNGNNSAIVMPLPVFKLHMDCLPLSSFVQTASNLLRMSRCQDIFEGFRFPPLYLISSVNLSNNPELTTVSLNGNLLTQLDISNNSNITSLDVRWNRIASLDYVVGWRELGLILDGPFNNRMLFFPQNVPVKPSAEEVFDFDNVYTTTVDEPHSPPKPDEV